MPNLPDVLAAQPAIFPSVPSLEKDSSIPLRGYVVNQRTNIPLAGMHISIYPADSPVSPGRRAAVQGPRKRALLLGSAVTNADGRFEVGFERSPQARDKRYLLGRDGLGRLQVNICAEAKGKVYGTFDVQVSQTLEPFRLELPLPEKSVPVATWRKMGQLLESTRTVRIHEVARRLASRSDTSLGGWDFETRQALLTQLEAEFLDPTGVLRRSGLLPTFHSLNAPGGYDEAIRALGNSTHSAAMTKALKLMFVKAESFDSIFLVDWVLDPMEIKKGKPGPGLDKFTSLYLQGVQAPDQGELEKQIDHWLHAASERSRYRDYLRTIYTGPTDSFDYTTRLKKLETRFHQNFETFDSDDQPANEVLIGILTEILKAKTGVEYGFGMAASSIEARGERTAREYLDYLIGLTKLPTQELRNRYRVNFARPDSAVSSRVRENIAALQGFFADGFQSPDDPVPLYSSKLKGLAPFFLQYEEWLSVNGPFYGENYYQIAATFRLDMDPESRDWFESDSKGAKGGGAPKGRELAIDFMLAENMLKEGHLRYAQGVFDMAREAYKACESLAKAALTKALMEDLKAADSSEIYASTVIKLLATRLQKLKALPVKGLKDVAAYTDAWSPPPYPSYKTYLVGNVWKSDEEPWLKGYRDLLEVSLLHLLTIVLPTLRGDLALAAGDFLDATQMYEQASRFFVARADLLDSEGYDPNWSTAKTPELIPTLEKEYNPFPRLYHSGALPYTTPRFQGLDPVNSYGYEGYGSVTWLDETAVELVKTYLHPMEKRYIRLRHGQALLEWADALYRDDNPSTVARARELYKAVLWMHGEVPDIIPLWPPAGLLLLFINQDENPALTSQKARARLGLSQIEQNLNYYGMTDDIVPSLRYRPLKDAADRYVATAYAAQQDFLLYMEKIEDAIRDGLIQSSALKKAQLQGQIASEQVTLADLAVGLAKNQIAQVEKAIQAKKDEIDKSEEFFNQFKDFVVGMKNTIEDLPAFLTTFGSKGAQTALGVEWTKGATLTGAAGGWGAMAGYGMFVYAGYTSLSNMADKANSLQAQLKTLMFQTLPLAKAQHQARQGEAAIARLNAQIAKADAALAQSLLKFQSARFLNAEFWAQLGSVMRRVMRRFLVLGARYAWMAERALAYEQNRPINIIRFDYFPQKLQGITGANLLQSDLGELEAARLEGIRKSMPVRRTVSLAFEYPLEFAQLKSKGVCQFFTQELPLRLAYPGIYGFRIRAVSVKVSGLLPLAPACGTLVNHGLSLISRADGSMSVSLRTEDACPLSEFELERDMAVYGLPNEALLLFEGSGFETLWTLNFPAAGNPNGLASVADIQLTFDLQAQYSAELAVKDAANVPITARRYIFLSARIWASDTLDTLKKTGSGSFALDPRQLPLPKQEKNRKLTNALIFVAQKQAATAQVTIKAAPGAPVMVTMEQNAAISNAPPFKVSANLPASPLNALVGRPLDQVFTVDIQSAADFSHATDLVLGLEYSADVTV